MAKSALALWALAAIPTVVKAQFPPPREDITTIKSKHHDGVSISYREPGICETTPGVKSYSGYVHLPPFSLNEVGESQPYPINTFFWFFESRKDPHNAPLSIWLNGGPGGSSLVGLLSENGPCFVNADSNSTVLNPWSWNNEVNMLYIDQPTQVGFSYDTLHNGTRNLALNNPMDEEATSVQIEDFSNGDIPEQNNTFLVGTFSSQKIENTANSTNHAAVALWHFAETWFEEFPEYKPHDEKISLWTESYGGKYGPGFMDFFALQNEKIANGTLSGPGLHYLHLDTLGIVNGCIDDAVQMTGYAQMAYNNTYGIQAINDTIHHKQMYEMERPGGLLDQVLQCQKMARELDPDSIGNVEEVNQFCANISTASSEVLVDPYAESGKYGWFDITYPGKLSFPPRYDVPFLNQYWVLKALGVPLNHSWYGEPVSKAFVATGDMSRGGLIDDIAYLLDNGVKVAMVYGDRDFACNWVGGEKASLSIPHKHKEAFAAAGYEPLTSSPIGSAPFVSYGQTRQHGNFSFTRMYQAGHMVPSYQPEASYKLFARSLFNQDIATGSVDLTKTGGWAGSDEAEIYSTHGPADTLWRKNEVMPAPDLICVVLAPGSCTEEQIQAIQNGTAIVKDFLLVGIEGDEEKWVPKTEKDMFAHTGTLGQKILGGQW